MPPASATEAATATAVMALRLSAERSTLPARAVTPSLTPVMVASIRLSISLKPIEMAIAKETPTVPANPAATEAPMATARIDELSVADRVTPLALMPVIAAPVGPLPEIRARTSAMIAFVATEPAPATPTPTVLAAPTATEAATTTAVIVSDDVAVIDNAPAASTAVSTRAATTSNGWRSPFVARPPMRFSEMAMPIEAPTPAAPSPTPTATAAATTTAEISAAAVASTVTWRPLSSTLPSA